MLLRNISSFLIVFLPSFILGSQSPIGSIDPNTVLYAQGDEQLPIAYHTIHKSFDVKGFGDRSILFFTGNPSSTGSTKPYTTICNLGIPCNTPNTPFSPIPNTDYNAVSLLQYNNVLYVVWVEKSATNQYRIRTQSFDRDLQIMSVAKTFYDNSPTLPKYQPKLTYNQANNTLLMVFGEKEASTNNQDSYYMGLSSQPHPLADGSQNQANADIIHLADNQYVMAYTDHKGADVLYAKTYNFTMTQTVENGLFLITSNDIDSFAMASLRSPHVLVAHCEKGTDLIKIDLFAPPSQILQFNILPSKQGCNPILTPYDKANGIFFLTYLHQGISYSSFFKVDVINPSVISQEIIAPFPVNGNCTNIISVKPALLLGEEIHYYHVFQKQDNTYSFCITRFRIGTFSPTSSPTELTTMPSLGPTLEPTFFPTQLTQYPSTTPSFSPTYYPTLITLTPTFQTKHPSLNPTLYPTHFPTLITLMPTIVTISPSIPPSVYPTLLPTLITDVPTSNTLYPTNTPSNMPTGTPTVATGNPTYTPTAPPSITPTYITQFPSFMPTNIPTYIPTILTLMPTYNPTVFPSTTPTYITQFPSLMPTNTPTYIPTVLTLMPTYNPTVFPSTTPTYITQFPSLTPTNTPTYTPTRFTLMPTYTPTNLPTITPTRNTQIPTFFPTLYPTLFPTGITNRPTNYPSITPTSFTFTPTYPTHPPSQQPTIMPSLTPTRSTEAPNAPIRPIGLLPNFEIPINTLVVFVPSNFTQYFRDTDPQDNITIIFLPQHPNFPTFLHCNMSRNYCSGTPNSSQMGSHTLYYDTQGRKSRSSYTAALEVVEAPTLSPTKKPTGSPFSYQPITFYKNSGHSEFEYAVAFSILAILFCIAATILKKFYAIKQGRLNTNLNNIQSHENRNTVSQQNNTVSQQNKTVSQTNKDIFSM